MAFRERRATWTQPCCRVRRVVAEFAEALDQPERLAEFERLVERAGL
jgi:hypothetical protein